MNFDRPSENPGSSAAPSINEETVAPSPTGWRELWSKEDWWAVWLGLGIVAAAIALFLGGSSLSWIAVAPAKWSDFSHLAGHFSENIWRYAAQFAFFVTVFSLIALAMRRNAGAFIPSFGFVYVLSAAALAAGNWSQAQRYNLEPPLWRW
jgi:hypothetical protein